MLMTLLFIFLPLIPGPEERNIETNILSPFPNHVMCCSSQKKVILCSVRSNPLGRICQEPGLRVEHGHVLLFSLRPAWLHLELAALLPCSPPSSRETCPSLGGLWLRVEVQTEGQVEEPAVPGARCFWWYH